MRGRLIKVRQSKDISLGRHLFRAWTERLPIEKTTTLHLSLINEAGKKISRWRYSSKGHKTRKAAIDAIGRHLERALQYCSHNRYRTHQLSEALRLAVESGDDQAALSAAWKCIAELPAPASGRCWVFKGRNGEAVPMLRGLSSYISNMLTGVSGQDQGWSTLIKGLCVEEAIGAIEDDVRQAAESHPDFAPWTDVLVKSVSSGFEAYKRLVVETEAAEPPQGQPDSPEDTSTKWEHRGDGILRAWWDVAGGPLTAQVEFLSPQGPVKLTMAHGGAVIHEQECTDLLMAMEDADLVAARVQHLGT